MSRSPSPASSLDYIHSDPSDDEYAELRRSMQKKKTKKAAAHPAEGQFDSDTEGEDPGFVDQFGAIDLSKQDLKPDHASRPLWIDQAGNM